MLLPNKHSHPDETVLAVATSLLRHLRRRQVIPFDELKRNLASRDGSAEFLFVPAVSLLFLVDLVQYNPVVDSFVYVGD